VQPVELLALSVVLLVELLVPLLHPLVALLVAARCRLLVEVELLPQLQRL
jgi:hypothetical protein